MALAAGLLSCPPPAPAGEGAPAPAVPGACAPPAAAAGCAFVSIFALRGRLRRVRPCGEGAP